MILSKVAHYGTPLMESLHAHGLHIERGTSFSNLDPDDIKFFLKQQQKCLADSQGTEEESEPGSVTTDTTLFHVVYGSSSCTQELYCKAAN